MNDVFIVYDCGDVRGVSHNLGEAIDCLFETLKIDGELDRHQMKRGYADTQWSKHDQMVRVIAELDTISYTITGFKAGANSIQRSLMTGEIQFDREHSPTCAVQQAVMDVEEGEDFDEIAEYLERTIQQMTAPREHMMEFSRGFLNVSKEVGRVLGSEFSDVLLGTEENPDSATIKRIIKNMPKNALEAFQAKCEPFLAQRPGFK
jgi:hypothetical protein